VAYLRGFVLVSRWDWKSLAALLFFFLGGGEGEEGFAVPTGVVGARCVRVSVAVIACLVDGVIFEAVS